LDTFLSRFLVPEKTAAGYAFADTPVSISFEESKVAAYGVPLDATTSFGKGTARGPEAVRLASARQIETFLIDKGRDIYDLCSLYDLGDVRIPAQKAKPAEKALEFVDRTVTLITRELRSRGKIPLMLGGEHTLSYFQLKELASEKPLVLHFDAHRDMKPEYDGMEMCHTTPFYHLLKSIKGSDIVQIGIRQADRSENEIAKSNGVVTFDAWKVHDDFDSVLAYIGKATQERNIYISFDIDAYDICFVPCTGTPEPFGLDPFQVAAMIDAINPTARLIGLDMVEVGLKNGDYREGALATQTLYRILAHKWANSLR
jgi:agmatinase